MAGRSGSTCHDEGDTTDPEPVTVTVTPEPPVCTPDSPPCPPCPPNVEAGWCADEDERQDTDDDFGEGDESGSGCKHVEGSGGCNVMVAMETEKGMGKILITRVVITFSMTPGLGYYEIFL